jgi:sugar lactone lactonase YvrE
MHVRSGLLTFALLLSGTAFAAEPRVIDGDAGFPEGPFVEDGTLYFAEYGANQVTSWDGSGLKTVWAQDGCGPSAVQRFGDGFLVTCYDNGTLALVAADGGSATVIDKDDRGDPLVGPNDIALDGKGGAYTTNSGPWESAPIVGKVLHVAPDGTATMVADDLHYANGLVLSADGSTLFVNESEAGRVIQFTVNADGSLTDRRLFVRLTDLDEPVGAYPDGIKLGPDGNYYIGLYSAGRIVVVDPDGKLVRKYEVPSPASPNLAFSEDGKTMYIMAVDDQTSPPYAGKVYALDRE